MSPVLIIEDHPLVAEATGDLLASLGAGAPVVCSNAEQAMVKLCDPGEPWFRILLDLDVPGAYGLSLAREVERLGLAGRCCVVSAFEKREYIDEIRRWGFLGYIVKATQISEFKAALKAVLHGRPSFPAVASGRRAQAIRLTRRQSQMLELLRRGLSSKEAAAELQISEGTVNNHVSAMLHVFEAGTRAQAVAKAIELGLLEAHPEPPLKARLSFPSGRQ